MFNIFIDKEYRGETSALFYRGQQKNKPYCWKHFYKNIILSTFSLN